MMMNTWTRVATGLVATAVLLMPVACGDDDPSEPTEVVAADLVTAVNANTVAALDGIAFNFNNAGAVFSPELAAQDVALTFETSGATPRATLKFEGGGEVVANVSFGSCIFVVSSSTFPSGHRLAPGSTVTVNPCNIRLNAQGAPADGVARSRVGEFVLGPAVSAQAPFTVSVNKSGLITVNGYGFGTVTLVPVTG